MFGPTRTHAGWKPRIAEGDLAFFQTPDTEQYALGLNAGAASKYDDTTQRSKLFFPDYLFMPESMANLRRARVSKADAEQPRLSYAIVGGFEHNAIEISWKDNARPRWIALKTFTGIQVKYIQPDKKPPAVFALADEDAYCYCNESPCKQCSFNCKSGFVLYALFDDIGIVRTDIDRISKD